jgi:hypothetical protein
MSIPAIFNNFVGESPVTIMMRGIMERVFSPDPLNKLFERIAKEQYTKELLYSNVVELMLPVVGGMNPSVHASFQAQKENINVSATSVYNKIAGIEPSVSAASVRYSAQELEPVIEALGGKKPDLVPGYRVRILDGNALKGTDHRLEVLRNINAGALPGKSLVVLDPALMLIIDLFPTEDGHAQERSLFSEVLKTVKAWDLWIADRNMCVLSFLLGIAQRKAAFVIREHASLPQKTLTPLRRVGECETGEVWEQTVQLEQDGLQLAVRRVVVRLHKPTRDGDHEIAILTNLPETVADGILVAQLYRNRWTVETLFQTVTKNLNCEIKTLAFPRAALFSFSMALFAYNALSTLKAALRGVHGVDQNESRLSDYYLVDAISMTYRGMMIAIPPPHWEMFRSMSQAQFCNTLRELAEKVKISAFLTRPRGPKKKKEKPPYDPKHPHVSTARLLKNKKNSS